MSDAPMIVKVKPLVWEPARDGNHRKGDVYCTRSPVSFAPIAAHRKHDGWWLNVDCKTYPTLEAAQAAAQADYEARILAALDLTPDPRVTALVEAAEALRIDMVERAQLRIDRIHGEQYRIVNAGCTAWGDFCAALAAFKGVCHD